MSGYDLHTHSSFSDGTETPTHNVHLAHERGVEGIGITDHDTFAGLDEAAAAGAAEGVDIVPGIEFSAEYDGASLHVLGYWVDPAHEPLREELQAPHRHPLPARRDDDREAAGSRATTSPSTTCGASPATT